MKVEEAEAKFDKHWSKWTEAEEREYVADLKPGCFKLPLNFKLAVKHFRFLAIDTLRELRSYYPEE
jgi:hypothetical protein